MMVNGLSMENVSSSFAIQTLKTCGKVANIVSALRWDRVSAVQGTAACLSHTARGSCPGAGNCSSNIAPGISFVFHLQTVKRAKKVHFPARRSSSPAAAPRSHSDEDFGFEGADPALPRSRDGLDHNRGYDGDSSSERSSDRHRDDLRYHKPASRTRKRSQDSSRRGQSPGSGSERRGCSRRRSADDSGGESDAQGLALVSGFKRLPRRDVPTKPITSVLVKQKQNEGEALPGPLALGFVA